MNFGFHTGVGQSTRKRFDRDITRRVGPHMLGDIGDRNIDAVERGKCGDQRGAVLDAGGGGLNQIVDGI